MLLLVRHLLLLAWHLLLVETSQLADFETVYLSVAGRGSPGLFGLAVARCWQSPCKLTLCPLERRLPLRFSCWFSGQHASWFKSWHDSHQSGFSVCFKCGFSYAFHTKYVSHVFHCCFPRGCPSVFTNQLGRHTLPGAPRSLAAITGL